MENNSGGGNYTVTRMYVFIPSPPATAKTETNYRSGGDGGGMGNLLIARSVASPHSARPPARPPACPASRMPPVIIF